MTRRQQLRRIQFRASLWGFLLWACVVATILTAAISMLVTGAVCVFGLLCYHRWTDALDDLDDWYIENLR